MSTTSSVITIAICVVLIIALGFALVKGLWSAAKKITLPIQIVLFLVMLTCVVRLFCTKENAQKLYKGIEQSGISQNVENTMRAALKMKPAEAVESEASTPAAREDTRPPKGEGLAGGRLSSAAEKEPEVNTAVEQLPPTPKAETLQNTLDYSHLDKGKKTFSYALPFNAKVTVGFKDDTYRVIVESLGSLDASEKKEVGKLIMTSLGKYVGKTTDRTDKSKITIDSRYDESDDRTRVFAIIPPDAIED
jgi:hypothetical protein